VLQRVESRRFRGGRDRVVAAAVAPYVGVTLLSWGTVLGILAPWDTVIGFLPPWGTAVGI
jgi:hypothetical protein